MTLTAESAPAAVDAAPDPLPGLIRDKLQHAPQPLKLAEVAKGLPRPPKVKAAGFNGVVLTTLEAEFQAGRLFHYPSGPSGAERFWARDEKQVLREAAVKAAAEPKALSALRTAVGKAVKGTAPGFVEDVIRALIGEDRLFEHPPKSKAGGPLFAAFAPPPPVPALQQAKFRKKVETLAKSAEKLLRDAGATLDDLFAAVRSVLSPTPAPGPDSTEHTAGADAVELDRLILDAVANAGPGSVVSLAELRRGLPPEFRGREFDAAVIRLADAGRVRVYQDSDPLQFTEQLRAEFVTDGAGHLYTSIARRG